ESSRSACGRRARTPHTPMREPPRSWSSERRIVSDVRDLIAWVLALLLLLVAASLATTLRFHRRRRQRARDSERAMGRRIVAELPTSEELVYFTEDDVRFHYGERSIDKDLIVAARVLINGAPIAAAVSKRHTAHLVTPTAFEDRPEGIARDRWDVAIETAAGTVLVECGAIRERVSQELARAIFDAVKRTIEEHNQESRIENHE
ncbi:MAG: hypothetical protein ACREUC_17505, partial [Steroidobacteraceae bacterium]